MIILHGALLDDALFLWGESPAEGAAQSKPRRRRPDHLPPYPYDAGAEAVTRAARELPIAFRPTARRKAEATAWLPTRGDHPLPSSALIGEAPDSAEPVETAPWRVEGIALTTAEALDLLSGYGQRAGMLHGVVGGPDLRFWIRAVRLAGSMVARQRYLPGTELDAEGKLAARWQPVWITEDLRYLDDLARAMPAAARALVTNGGAAPQKPSVKVVKRFVEQLVDHIVRSHREPEAEDGIVSVSASLFGGEDSPDSTVHDRWLAALRAEQAALRGKDNELEDLSEQIREWRKPLDATIGAPFRLCFRLEEPAPPREEPRQKRPYGKRNVKARTREAMRPGQRRWYVRYLLQGTDDPSLLVPTADAWILRGRKAAALQRSGSDVHQTLLLSLAQAAGVCPKIEMSLRSRKPSGYSLDARGAHEFLTQTAPALEQAGFGTILPEWWTGGSTRHRLSVRARVRTPEQTELDHEPKLDESVSFDWEVCLAGQPLSGRDLEDLARLKEPLQRVRGHWVQTSVEEIHAALEFYKNRRGGEVTAREIVRMALGAADTSAGIHFEGVRATGWLGALLERLSDKNAIEPLATPPGFTGELRPYQEKGFAWLEFLRRWELGACLADDMGLGKTIQTLALIERERNHGEDRPVLLVCPTSVLANWEREAARFTPSLRIAIHHGPQRKKGYEFVADAQDHALVLTSYALVQRDLEDLRSMRWAGVILDEAQNIKNPDTKQSMAVRAVMSDYRAALTGTPVENHVGDLWSIMDFLNPDFLGTQEQFRRDFLVPIQAHRDPDAVEKLAHITNPFIMRRLKTDRAIISDLPDKLEMKVFSTLTGEQGALYQQVVDEAERKLEDAEGIERRGVILATLVKLKQVCNHPAHYLGDGSALPKRSGKLTRLAEMLEEVTLAGDRTLVFTQFAEMGKLLQEHLQDELGREIFFLHGGTPKKRRDQMVERFQSGGGDAPPVFVLSLKAGGLGLNLTGANHVFHFDRWWNPAVENQATDRAFRIGQTRNVQVHKFVCVGTLEERIDEMIERKKSIAEDIVGTGEQWITELSNAELHEVFSLRTDAVRD
jgi:SNF2 family DNA or RNA helicase